MLPRALLAKFIPKPSTFSHFQFNQQRGLHSRNKKAMEFIAKGWNALKEVDRVIDYCELNDRRLIPLLNTAKESFELALEADNTNTHARYWLARLHMKYHVPGQNKAVAAALLVEAADMGDPDAQYALGCHLRVQNDDVQSDQQAFYYLEKAVDQLHPDALYLLGTVYLTGDCVKKDTASALWCFHRASEKGHAGAAIACGSLLLKEPTRVPDLWQITAHFLHLIAGIAPSHLHRSFLLEFCCAHTICDFCLARVCLKAATSCTRMHHKLTHNFEYLIVIAESKEDKVSIDKSDAKTSVHH